MNNERAIQLLHRLQDEQFDGEYGDERREALDMAVRALEGDGDTISRKMAIDALREHRALYCDNTPETFSKLSYAEKSRVDELDTAIATLVNLPPAQPTQSNADSTQSNALDYVSRQAAIDAVVSAMIDGADAELVEGVMELLPSARPEQPKSCNECENFNKTMRLIYSAQPEQRWIPCSERLPEHPENDDYYLVTIQCEHYDGWDDYVTGFAEWTKHGWDELSCYIGQIKVIAWMPLPKPYGGESE